MGAGFPINFQVSEKSPIFTHPLYLKWSLKTIGTALGEKSDLIQDISGIYPNPDTQELLAYLASILRVLNEMA
jgi:hypothetical protein